MTMRAAIRRLSDSLKGRPDPRRATAKRKTDLAETVQNAAQGLSLRTIKDAQVESVSVTDIKGSFSYEPQFARGE